MPTGFLTAQVVTSRGAIPIEGASVSVTTAGGGTLLGFRITNSAGNTAPITLDAPAHELSEAPAQDLPFASYDLRIDHPLFFTLLVKNAQVFAGTTTVQNVELIPLQEHSQPGNRAETVTVPPQNL